MLLAFDDTDSVSGGCTTHLAYELVSRLGDVDLIGPPRLVRLNPNIPHKTRGNGSVALSLGRGRGTPSPIGMRDGEPLLAYAEAERDLSEHEAERVLATAQRLIHERARLDDPKTNPGLALLPRSPPPELYSAAVHRYVAEHEALAALGSVGARFVGWKNGRGLIGAAAAAAWPGLRGTYEWIAYRDPPRWGTVRGLRPDLGPELDRHHPSTFDNYDALHHHLRIAPRSPCPVLAGIRGVDPADVRRAAARLGPEPPQGGLLFATNQATDDHLVATTTARLRPWTSVSLEARVVRRGQTWPGGHVFVRVADETGAVDLAAFEPTKEFRDAVRRLRPGDRVRAHGGTHADPSLIALEKLDVLAAAARARARAPACAACGRRMDSRGRGAAYRCRRCHVKRFEPEAEDDAAAVVARYEVPVAVRRHLSRPNRLVQLVEPIVAPKETGRGKIV